MSTIIKSCPKQVSDGHRWPSFHTCSRPVERDGLCGLHASAKDHAELLYRHRHLRGALEEAADAG